MQWLSCLSFAVVGRVTSLDTLSFVEKKRKQNKPSYNIRSCTLLKRNGFTWVKLEFRVSNEPCAVKAEPLLWVKAAIPALVG
jgi:hypothetical protein